MKPVRFTVYCMMFSIVFLFGLLVKDVKSMCIRTMDISGGEDHTMVLTENGLVFTCGLDQNSDYFYYGALGIGTFTGSYKDTLVQVLDGQMETSTGYLEDIADIAAGLDPFLGTR